MSSMSKRYQNSSRSGLSRTTTDILLFALFAAAVATLNGVVMHKPKLEQSIAMFLLSFALGAGPMLVFSFILRRRNRSTRLFAEAVARELREGLDRSPFNPHLNKQHEQHTNQTSTKPR